MIGPRPRVSPRRSDWYHFFELLLVVQRKESIRTIGDVRLYGHGCNALGKRPSIQDTIHDRKQQKTLVVASILLRVE